MIPRGGWRRTGRRGPESRPANVRAPRRRRPLPAAFLLCRARLSSGGYHRVPFVDWDARRAGCPVFQPFVSMLMIGMQLYAAQPLTWNVGYGRVVVKRGAVGPGVVGPERHGFRRRAVAEARRGRAGHSGVNSTTPPPGQLDRRRSPGGVRGGDATMEGRLNPGSPDSTHRVSDETWGGSLQGPNLNLGEPSSCRAWL